MKKILIFGAGRSAGILIDYLLEFSQKNNYRVVVADYSETLAKQSINNHPNGTPIVIDVFDEKSRAKIISSSEIVVSMLPASMHILVARDCIIHKKNLITASYASKDILDLDKEVKKSGLLFLNEIGLDPGIDHMSAMQIIDSVKKQNGVLKSFKSYCGGLIHPKYDDNPWNYKFTWNPKNVVLAGNGVAQYLDGDQIKYIPYNKLFTRVESVNFPELGCFEAYANRDSLSYKNSYRIENISTLLRGTLRREGFSKAWNIFVQLGLTDDSYYIDTSNLTLSNFLSMYLPKNKGKSLEDNFCEYLNCSKESDEFKKIEWLGFFSDKKINLDKATPAEFLQSVLESKWFLSTNDKDMIVMQHQFEYMKDSSSYKLISSLVVYGDDNNKTAMAKTVGLPVAIATKLILQGKIRLKGVHIPNLEQVYTPVLDELKDFGIFFSEELVKIN